jgi:hypothetical protein
MKFCKDCNYYWYIEPVATPYACIGSMQGCAFTPAPVLHDPITGKSIPIASGRLEDIRQDPSRCGLEARWFKEKE